MLAAVHLSVLAVLPISGLPPQAALLLAAPVVGSLWRSLERHAWLCDRNALQELVWEPSGSWQVRCVNGRRYSAWLRGDCLVHPWLIVLNFRLDDSSRRSLMLLPDSLSPEIARRLRVRLRLEAPVDIADRYGA